MIQLTDVTDRFKQMQKLCGPDLRIWEDGEGNWGFTRKQIETEEEWNEVVENLWLPATYAAKEYEILDSYYPLPDFPR